MSERVLIKFTHGLGDSVQLTVVLKHLRKYRPNWSIDVVAQRGKHSCYLGLCAGFYHFQEVRPEESSYSKVFDLPWFENYNSYDDRPNSKITNCLAEIFRIAYDESLASYQVAYRQSVKDRVDEYLDVHKIGFVGKKRKAVVIHYEGNTSPSKKNLHHDYISMICNILVMKDYTPIILDWDNRSPVPNGKTILKPGVSPNDIWGGFGSGDAETIAALIDSCCLFIGIDSGPGKVASATTTETLIVWTEHHPFQFHDPADNTTHLVPENWRIMPPIYNQPNKLATFSRLYKFVPYKKELFMSALFEEVDKRLDLKHEKTPEYVNISGMWIRYDSFDQDMIILNDILFQDGYKIHFYNTNEFDYVIDVGAHIGSFAKLIHNRNPNAKIICIEACPENIELLKRNVGDFATIVQAACTYEKDDLFLLNSVKENGESTGGSIVVKKEQLLQAGDARTGYWNDTRPLRKVTLEEVCKEFGFPRIDMLKLDCEGSEFSILPNTKLLPYTRCVFGEFHGTAAWDTMRPKVFSGWDYGDMYRNNDSGIFHLVNKKYTKGCTFLGDEK